MQVCECCSSWKRQRLPWLRCHSFQLWGCWILVVGQESWGRTDSWHFGTEKKASWVKVPLIWSKIAVRFQDCSTAHPHLSTALGCRAEGPRSSHGHRGAPSPAEEHWAHKLPGHLLLMTVTSNSAARGKAFPPSPLPPSLNQQTQ